MANTLTFTGFTVTDANIYGGINYTIDLNPKDEFAVGNVASAEVSFETDLNTLRLFSKDANAGAFTWSEDGVNRGTFYISEIVKSQGMYTVTAYDKISLLSSPISALSITTPTTISAVVGAITSHMGCSLVGTLTNGSLQVIELPSDSTTIRELLGYALEYSGCSAMLDSSGDLKLIYYPASGITVTNSDYKSVEVADYVCAAIDCVEILDISSYTLGAYGSGSNTLYIHNPLITQADNTTAENIFGKVNGLTYTPLTCELFGTEGIEVGESATFGTISTLVMCVSESQNGVIMSSVGLDERESVAKDDLTIVSEKANAAGKTATNYLWYDAQNGLYVTDDTELLQNAVKIDSDSVDIVKGGQTVAEYSQGLTVWSDNGTEIAHLGYGTTQGQSGQTTSPYYDLGVRAPNTTKGAYSVAEGSNTTASGQYSHAEGHGATASGHDSHAEGTTTTASGESSHSEGRFTTARGLFSHAEGNNTTAIGRRSHAEGGLTTANGHDSHAEGYNTTASGDSSHAEGYYTIASGDYSHAQGKYNVDNSNHADIVGNGTSDSNRSNAYALDWNGNGYYKGDVYVGCNAGSSGGTKLIPFTKGTSNSWEYTKYTDGTFEAWRTYVTGSTALTNATNGAYSYSNWTSISAPTVTGIRFTPTHVQATCRNGGRFVSAYTSGTNVLFKVYACASVSTAQTYTVDLHIRGTWS